MKQRKHRLVVKFTCSKPVTEAQAVRGLDLLLRERLDLERAPIWANASDIYGEKITVKAFSRVLDSFRRKFFKTVY